MIRRRDTILSKLTKRSYSTGRLAEELGVSPATVRKHIELLRKEGHDVRYDRKDGKYYTREAVASMKRTEDKLKEFLGQWIGQPSPGHDEQAINRIYRILGEGAAEVEEKAAQLILRYIIRNYNQEQRLTIELIQESLGLDKELVDKVLRRLVSERIIARKEFGDIMFYNFEGQRPAFIEAVNKGYLTLTAKEIEELLTVRKSTKPPSFSRGAVNSLAVYPHGTGKVYRWVPYTGSSFLIPEIFNAFTTSFSRECYQAQNGHSFSGHGFWEYMPRIIYYQQGMPSAEGREKGPRPQTKPMIPTFPESSLVQALIARQEPDPHLYSLLGFGDTTTPAQLSKAVGAVETARIRSLLAYHKGFHDKIKADGVGGLEKEVERMTALQEESDKAREKGESEFCMEKAKPSVWLTSAYLMTLGKIFEYAAACAQSSLSNQYVGRLKEYSDTFIQAARELEARHPPQEPELIDARKLEPLEYELADGQCPPRLAEILKIEVSEVVGTSRVIRPGDSYLVRGRYELSSPEVAYLCLADSGTSSGQFADLSPGSGEFEVTANIMTVNCGAEKYLALLMFDGTEEAGKPGKELGWRKTIKLR